MSRGRRTSVVPFPRPRFHDLPGDLAAHLEREGFTRDHARRLAADLFIGVDRRRWIREAVRDGGAIGISRELTLRMLARAARHGWVTTVARLAREQWDGNAA